MTRGPVPEDGKGQGPELVVFSFIYLQVSRAHRVRVNKKVTKEFGKNQDYQSQIHKMTSIESDKAVAFKFR
jgi:hypothetical protein